MVSGGAQLKMDEQRTGEVSTEKDMVETRGLIPSPPKNHNLIEKPKGEETTSHELTESQCPCHHKEPGALKQNRRTSGPKWTDVSLWRGH